MHGCALCADSMARAIEFRAGANPILPIHDLRSKVRHDFGNSRLFVFSHGALRTWINRRSYSHSMVAGGLEEMS